MTRHRIALLCLLAGALVAALVPWTVRSDRVVSALSRQIRQGYGIALASNGQLTFTLLPMPQLVLSDVRLASADGAVRVEAEELRTQLRLLSLLRARLRLSKAWLAGGRVTVTLPEGAAPGVGGALERMRRWFSPESDSRWVPRIDRFLLTDGDVTIRDREGRALARLARASLVLNSPEPDGDFDIRASAEWNGEAVIVSLTGLNLAALRDGRPQTIAADATGRIVHASLEGRLTFSDRPHLVGSLKGRTESLARLSRWSGLLSDVARTTGPGSVSGQVSLDPDGIQLPRTSVEIGPNRFDGAAAMQFGPRPQVRATIAGETVDLGWLGRVVDPKESERLGADYDVRLSASELAFGALRLQDAALSVQSNAHGIELSLGRAAFAGGALRGRISAALDGEGRDIRMTGWADGIDLARALADLAGLRGVTGTAGGQAALDITGDRSGSLASQLRGRGTIQARNGEFAGAAIAEAAKRQTHDAVPSDWRSGRASFNEARATIAFERGQARLSDGVVETAGASAQLTGSVDLATLNAALRITSRATAAPTAPPVTIDLDGPLRRLGVSGASASPAQRPR